VLQKSTRTRAGTARPEEKNAELEIGLCTQGLTQRTTGNVTAPISRPGDQTKTTTKEKKNCINETRGLRNLKEAPIEDQKTAQLTRTRRGKTLTKIRLKL